MGSGLLPFESSSPLIKKSKSEVKIMELFIPLNSEVRFPNVISLYLLFRIETKLDLVDQSIQSLPERIRD